jgi:hypothetical protein
MNLEENISKIVQFLELSGIDIKKVVAGSQFESKDKYFYLNETDDRIEVENPVGDVKLVKRKGTVDSWKSELTEESLQYYRKYFE